MIDSNKIICIYNSQLFYGHERANMQVFKVLSDQGYELLVLTNKKGISDEAKGILDSLRLKWRPITYPDWEDVRKPFTLFKSSKYVLKVLKSNLEFFIQHIRFKPDYIYIGKAFPFINLIPCFLIINTRIVYRIGDAPVLQWKVFNFFWKSYIVKRVYKFVFVSNYIKSTVRNVGRSSKHEDKVIYSYPSFRLPLKDTLTYNKSNVTFSYLGQIIKVKGVEVFVRAALEICNEFQNVNFLVAGDLNYDPEFSKSITELVRENNLEDRIIFLGKIENLTSFFNSTSISVIPSLRPEPLANTLVEAKFYDTASIIFDSGGLPELVTHKKDGYICSSSDILGMTEALRYYLLEPSAIVQHSEEAKRSLSVLGIDMKSFNQKWSEIFK